MRLGLVIYGSLEAVTGGFMYDRLVVDYLRRQGDTVEVISLPWQPYAIGITQNFRPEIFRRLQRGRFEVIIQDELAHPSLFGLNRRLRAGGSPPIIGLVHLLRSAERRPAWQNAVYRQIERWYLQSVDGYIAISRHTLDLVSALAGTGKPAVVAYPAGDRLGGLSPEVIAARVKAPGPRQILYLGALIPRKGLDVLLRALAPLQHSDWRLLVVGSLTTDPGFARKIFQLISRLGLSHRVRMPGVLRGADLQACLRQSHILALPSDLEGLALVYLEGMHYGLVPLAAAAGAAGEVITHGRDGFLIPPRDEAALRAGLAALLADDDRLLTMSLAARERISRHPTWDKTGGVIRDFLLRLTTVPAGRS